MLVLEYSASGNVVANASSTITLEFVERRRLRIRLVRIHYTGTQNNVKKDVAARSVQDFWDATDYAQHVLPIPSPGFEIVKESVEEYDGNFTRIDPSAHDQTWPGSRPTGARPATCSTSSTRSPARSRCRRT